MSQSASPRVMKLPGPPGSVPPRVLQKMRWRHSFLTGGDTTAYEDHTDDLLNGLFISLNSIRDPLNANLNPDVVTVDQPHTVEGWDVFARLFNRYVVHGADISVAVRVTESGQGYNGVTDADHDRLAIADNFRFIVGATDRLFTGVDGTAFCNRYGISRDEDYYLARDFLLGRGTSTYDNYSLPYQDAPSNLNRTPDDFSNLFYFLKSKRMGIKREHSITTLPAGSAAFTMTGGSNTDFDGKAIALGNWSAASAGTLDYAPITASTDTDMTVTFGDETFLDGILYTETTRNDSIHTPMHTFRHFFKNGRVMANRTSVTSQTTHNLYSGDPDSWNYTSWMNNNPTDQDYLFVGGYTYPVYSGGHIRAVDEGTFPTMEIVIEITYLVEFYDPKGLILGTTVSALPPPEPNLAWDVGTEEGKIYVAQLRDTLDPFYLSADPVVLTTQLNTGDSKVNEDIAIAIYEALAFNIGTLPTSKGGDFLLGLLTDTATAVLFDGSMATDALTWTPAVTIP